jgi:hypothetical protein
MGGLVSPSRTANPTQLSPRIDGVGRKASSNGTSIALPSGRLVAMGRGRISLILVPNWLSLISLVGSRRPLSWASILWRQDGLGAARERGESRPPPACPLSRCPFTLHRTSYVPSAVVDSSIPPKDRQADSATVSFCMVRLPPRFLTESTRIEIRTVPMASCSNRRDAAARGDGLRFYKVLRPYGL